MKAFAVALTFATALGIKLQQNLPVAQKAGEIFDDIDTNGDTNMTTAELEGALKTAGFNAKVTGAITKEFAEHPETQGSVTRADFVSYMTDLYEHALSMGVTDKEIMAAVDNFDPSKVTMGDLKAANAHLEQHGLKLAAENDRESAHAFIAEEMGKMFDDANTDGNDHVDTAELEAALKHAGFTDDVVAALTGEFESHPEVQGKVTKDDFIGFGQDLYDHAASQGISDEEMIEEFENFDPSAVTVGDLKAARDHLREHDLYGTGL